MEDPMQDKSAVGKGVDSLTEEFDQLVAPHLPFKNPQTEFEIEAIRLFTWGYGRSCLEAIVYGNRLCPPGQDQHDGFAGIVDHKTFRELTPLLKVSYRYLFWLAAGRFIKTSDFRAMMKEIGAPLPDRQQMQRWLRWYLIWRLGK